FGYPESAAHALGLACRRAAWLRRPAGTIPRLDGIDRNGAAAVIAEALALGDDSWLDPRVVRRLLSSYGLPVVEERQAATPKEAADAASELGYPVVVKTAAPGVHKSDAGGVRLDLRDAEEVVVAALEIGGPVVVQRFVRGGAELLAG